MGIEGRVWFALLTDLPVFQVGAKMNAKNIGNFTTLLKPHNIGTHLKGIETSFQVVPLFFEILPLLEFYHFFKFSQNTFSH
jgi:hypothetical protein